MNQNVIAYVLVLLGIVCGSSGPSVFLLVMKEVNRDVSIVIFLLLGGITMFIIEFFGCLLKNQSLLSLIKKANKAVHYWQWLITGVAVGVIYLFYTRSLQLKSVSETMLVYRIAPLLSIFLAIHILGERIKKWQLLLLATTVCFVGIVITQDISNFNPRVFTDSFILFTFIAAIAYAVKINMERYIQRKGCVSSNIVAGTTMLIGCIFMLVYTLFALGKSFVVPEWKNIFLLSYIGIVTVGLPIVLNLKAYKITGNYSMFAFFQYLIPLCGAIFAYFVHGERGIFDGNLIVGFVVISFGIYLANKSIDKNSINSMQKKGGEND